MSDPDVWLVEIDHGYEGIETVYVCRTSVDATQAAMQLRAEGRTTVSVRGTTFWREPMVDV